MDSMKLPRSKAIVIASMTAIIFAVLTIKSGGAVLFFDGADRQAAGHFVPLVLWFNFFAGFLYLIAGIGLYTQRYWAAFLAFFIVSATLVVFIYLGAHILYGGLYEIRTVAAMSLRTLVWSLIAYIAYVKIIKN